MRGSIFFIVIALMFIVLTTSFLFINLNSNNSTNSNLNINNNNFNKTQSHKSAISVSTGNIIQDISQNPPSNTYSNISTNNNTNSPPNNTIPFKPINRKTYTIEITKIGFSPSELKIKKGDSIIWINRDYTEHSIASDSGQLDSDYLKEDKFYDYVFNTTGTFDYYCGIHPSRTGKVTVE